MRAWFAAQINHITNAWGYSWQGLSAAFNHEIAFRQELMACIALVPAAFFVGHTWLERVLLLSTLMFVFIVELLNSAIEAVVDRIGLERHELSGRAKDLGSAAVFLSLIMTAMIWFAVLLS